MQYHNINGSLILQTEASLHVSDLTFRRGYGAFDYLRVHQGIPLFIDDHLARFEMSARHLKLALPLSQADLKTRVLELIAHNKTAQAGIQMFLTAGYAEDGFTPTDPNLILLELPLSLPNHTVYEQGVRLIMHEYQRDFPEAKTTNYLMAVYLGFEMRQTGAADALYYHNGLALETTRSNIFALTADDRLITPAQHMLKGVTRKHLLKVASKLIPIEERPVRLVELFEAKEVFISSTTKGVMPVVQIGSQTIANGTPGPFSKALREAFQQYIHDYLAAVAVPG